jgi:acyl-CoA synthetase (NDP forming)
VAIVGASAHEHKWGFRVTASALMSTDRREIHLINRNGGSILGHPLHRSLSELPSTPELVVVAVPAAQFDRVVEEAADAGARAIVGITAGLGEKGGPAAMRERERTARFRRAGMMMLGPNCAGLADSDSGFRLEFTPQPFGGIGLVSQSGNLIVELSRLLAPRGLGFSRYVSVGNQADLVVADFLEDLVDHDATQVIGCYVEDFTDGRRFVRAAGRAVAAGKSVAVLTGGRTAPGSRTARSHTGAIVSDHRVVAAACRTAGAELVLTPGELADVLDAWRSRLAPTGPRVAVLGDGGGHCAVAADVLCDHGLSVQPLSRDTQRRVAALLPATATVANPIDIAGAAEIDLTVYSRLVEALVSLAEIDAVLLTGYFGGYSAISRDLREREEAVARAMAAVLERGSMPLVAHSIHPGSPAIAVLRAAGVPVYERIESAARALAVLAGAASSVRNGGSREDGSAGSDLASTWAPPTDAGAGASEIAAGGYFAARELLARAGIPQLPAHRVRRLDEALAAAREVGYPVALKAVGVSHKSDAGGVVLGIENPPMLEDAFATVTAGVGGELSVEPMAPTADGVEMIMSVRRDERFGWIVMAGLGGIYAEVFDDVAVRLAPVSTADLARGVLNLRCAPLLTGARGRRPLDVAALCRAASALARTVTGRDDLDEVEVNPILVLPHSVLALDARIVRRAGSLTLVDDGGPDDPRGTENMWTRP